MTKRDTRTGIDRRTLLKYSVAGGAALTTGAVYAPAVHAQAKPIKLGYVSPQTGPLAAFAEADNFVLGAVPRGDEGRPQGRQRHAPVEVMRQGQPVQSQPRRRSRQGADRPRQGRSDAGRLDAGDHQSGLRPSARSRRWPCVSTNGAVAALVHRPAGQSRRRPAGLEAVQLHLPLLLGPGGRDRRLHQHVEPGRDQQVGRRRCFPTTATAMPGATSRWASRPCSTSRATS